MHEISGSRVSKQQESSHLLPQQQQKLWRRSRPSPSRLIGRNTSPRSCRKTRRVAPPTAPPSSYLIPANAVSATQSEVRRERRGAGGLGLWGLTYMRAEKPRRMGVRLRTRRRTRWVVAGAVNAESSSSFGTLGRLGGWLWRRVD